MMTGVSGCFEARELERRQAVVIAQVVIAQNEIEGLAVERRLERVPVRNVHDVAAHRVRVELMRDQLRVAGIVFEVQHFDLPVHCSSLAQARRVMPTPEVSRRGKWSTGEIERRAAIRLGLRPYPAAMPGDDTAYISKTDAGALELLGAMQALKDAEELAGVLHVEAHAVVAHEEKRLPFSSPAQPTSIRARSRGNVYLMALPRRLAKTCLSIERSPVTGGQRLDMPFDIAPARGHLQVFDDLPHQRVRARRGPRAARPAPCGKTRAGRRSARSSAGSSRQ